MENCPYCNEFMEIASDTPDCTHNSIDPQGEYCCLNCNAHFDLDLQEVPIDEGINKKPSTPTNPTPPEQESNTESSTESNKGDSSTESKGESKEDSKENPSTPQEPQTPQPPQNLTLSTQKQITLAKNLYASLQKYNNYTKINTDITPIIESLQDYLAQDFDSIA